MPNNLSGQTLRKLKLLRVVKQADYGGQLYNFYRCQCVMCGRKETMVYKNIVRKDIKREGCSICRRGPCLNCGSEIVTKMLWANYCSAECRKIKRLELQMASNQKCLEIKSIKAK